MNTHRRPDCFRLIRVAQTSVCGGLQPNAAYFYRTWDSAFVVGRTPWRVPSGPRDALVPLFARRIKPFHNSGDRPGGRARGPAADEGVRPTNYACLRLWEKYVALPLCGVR